MKTAILLFLSALALPWAHAQQVDWAQLKNGPLVTSSSYTFTLRAAQVTGDLSSSGARTITIASPQRCPQGVSGSDSNHWIYISGGTGTAEAVLITGGTCTSGSAGTLQFTTANTHTGAWTIQSATAGIQEAANIIAATGGEVRIPPGTHQLQGPVVITTHYIALVGAGPGATVLQSQWTIARDVIQFIGAWGVSVQDVTISCQAAATSGYAVSVKNGVQFWARRIITSYCPSGFELNNNNQASISDISLGELEGGTGVGVFLTGVSNFVVRLDRIVANSSTPHFAGLRVRELADGIVNDSHFLSSDYGVLVDPGNGQTVASLEMNSVYSDTNGIDGYLFAGTAGSNVVRTRCNSCWAVGASQNGVRATETFGGNIDGLSFIHAQIFSNDQRGMFIEGASNVSIMNSRIGSNSLASSGTYDGVTINASDWTFTGNVCGGALDGIPDNTQRYCLSVFDPANTNYTITGNHFRSNVTGAVSDSGSAPKLIRANFGYVDYYPASCSGQPAGTVWNDTGTLKVCP